MKTVSFTRATFTSLRVFFPYFVFAFRPRLAPVRPVVICEIQFREMQPSPLLPSIKCLENILRKTSALIVPRPATRAPPQPDPDRGWLRWQAPNIFMENDNVMNVNNASLNLNRPARLLEYSLAPHSPVFVRWKIVFRSSSRFLISSCVQWKRRERVLRVNHHYLRARNYFRS